MKPFVKSEITHLLLQLRYYFLQRRPNVASEMGLGVNSRHICRLQCVWDTRILPLCMSCLFHSCLLYSSQAYEIFPSCIHCVPWKGARCNSSWLVGLLMWMVLAYTSCILVESTNWLHWKYYYYYYYYYYYFCCYVYYCLSSNLTWGL